MFVFEDYKWEEYEVKRLINHDSGDFIEFVPRHGALLVKMFLNGKQILQPFESLDDFKSNPWYKNTILFPFPNRLEGGQYNHDGKALSFDVNEVANNNALHGYLYNRPFEVVEVIETGRTAEVRLSPFELPSNLKASYPFDYRLEVCLGLKAPHTFYIGFKVKNLGDDMPFGLGWHPYFKFDQGTASDWQLQFASGNVFEVNDKMIPTGKSETYSEFATLKPIADTQLDTGFKLSDTKSPVVLANSDAKISLTQSGQFEYLQIFIPPHRKSVAIEPMTCLANAFNNKQGLRVLKSGESWEGRVEVSVG